MKKKFYFLLIVIFTLLSGCSVGPNYVKPPVTTPATFKEARTSDWKPARPQDAANRGEWWKVFKDPQLNALEAQLNITNQNIINAEANYRQASALVDEARASFFPTLTGSLALTRQKQVSGSSSFISTSSSGSTSTGSATTSAQPGGTIRYSTTHSLILNASWEPDIWGSVGRTVEASRAGAESSAALLAVTRLSAQASLAQFYFELRALDTDQKILNNTVKDYQKSLTLTQHQYNSGIVARSDVIQAQTQLDTAKSQALNNGIARSQYEHAIAVLTGEPPANFAMSFQPLTATPPHIPLEIPSELLERRPDIAQAERLMAQANAQIGVATAAYFPTFTLNGAGTVVGSDYAHWFSFPSLAWSIGPQLAETFYDGGLRNATLAAAHATYDANVAAYRQTVLSAFQDVEDNLVSLRILKSQYVVQNQAAKDARLALKLMMNQYKAGIVPYSSVIVAQTTAYTAEKNAADVNGLQMTSAVGLIKALGGGWYASSIMTQNNGKS